MATTVEEINAVIGTEVAHIEQGKVKTLARDFVIEVLKKYPQEEAIVAISEELIRKDLELSIYKSLLKTAIKARKE